MRPLKNAKSGGGNRSVFDGDKWQSNLSTANFGVRGEYNVAVVSGDEAA